MTDVRELGAGWTWAANRKSIVRVVNVTRRTGSSWATGEVPLKKGGARKFTFKFAELFGDEVEAIDALLEHLRGARADAERSARGMTDTIRALDAHKSAINTARSEIPAR